LNVLSEFIESLEKPEKNVYLLGLLFKKPGHYNQMRNKKRVHDTLELS